MTLRSSFLALLVLPLPVSAQQMKWTASRIHGTPEPPKPFIAEQVFAKLPLTEALDMVPVPGMDQWLYVQNNGKLVVAPDDSQSTKTSVALDLQALHPAVDHAYGVAFHPHFKENHQVFVTYTNGDKLDDGSRLSRFKVKQGPVDLIGPATVTVDKKYQSTFHPPVVIDPTSEEILLTWRSGGHNGAAIGFGNDGLLYLSTGDSEVPAPPDPLKTGQDLTDFLSSVLRIDVDHTPDPGKAYHVPADNPFLTTPKARPEIYAYGLRNPWKMSFDRSTGNLWCGDVGWEQWEQIQLIKRGGNYGWSATEGNNVLFPERKGGPSPITPPVVTHSHAESASITGGFVYHGRRLPELEGAYVYGDYETGKIWALWYEGGQIKRHEEIASTPVKIVTFGQGEDGELYFIHWNKQSTVHRLVRNPAVGQPSSFPRKLSESGLFSDVVKQTPASGVHPFAIHAPMWMDGAQGGRFIGIPQGKVESSPDKVTWPKDAVLAKTLSMEIEQGKPATVHKIETQVLHFDGLTWNAYSYRWNDEGTDAELVGPAGDERKLDLTGAGFPGGKHRYTYRFHNRAECLRCHNSWNNFTLGFQPQQLTDEAAILAAGVVDKAFFKRSATRLVSPHDAKAPLEARARSWLHANCSACHRENGGGSVPLMLNAELALKDLRALDEKPTRGDFGVADAKVIRAGDPAQSVLLHRLATTAAGHMPAIGPHEVDDGGLALLSEWMRSLALACLPLPAHEPERALITILDRRQDPHFEDAVMAAKASPDAHIRGLYERFLRDDQRVETLGTSATAEKLLSISGDATRGMVLMTPTGKAAACLACHFINGNGRDFGPDLSKVGARLPKPQIAEAVLQPSKTIAQGFNAVAVTLADGSAQVGFVVKREADQLLLKIATGQTVPLKTRTVKSEQPLPVSLMPEGLLMSFTAQEAADLLEYLASLK